MTDIFDEIEADAIEAGEATVASDEDLVSLAKLVDKQLELEDDVDQLESALKDAKEKLVIHRTRTLPEHMNALGTGLWKSETGTTVELKPFVSASIPSAKKEEAHGWLLEHGHGDIIKNEVSIGFGKQEHAKAMALIAKLIDDGYSPSSKESVHSGTLKAWLKEQVAEGTPVPLELFGAYLGQVATIKKGR